MSILESLNMSLAIARSLAGYALWALRTRPPSSRGRARAGDIDIFYRRYGAGPPVLLLHGGFMFAEAWAGQFPELSRRHLVIAPDSRGHGRTTLGTRDLTYRQMAEDFALLIEELRLGPVYVVGNSDGGTTALALAMQRPELVRGLVLLGTPFNTSNYSEEAWREVESFLRPLSPELLAVRAVRQLLTPEPGKGAEFVRRMAAMWRELPDFTVEELGRITVPVLVVACDRDEFLSFGEDPLKVFKDTAAAIPRARLETVRGGTHVVHEQKPREVNRLILDFISST